MWSMSCLKGDIHNVGGGDNVGVVVAGQGGRSGERARRGEKTEAGCGRVVYPGVRNGAGVDEG